MPFDGHGNYISDDKSPIQMGSPLAGAPNAGWVIYNW